MCLALCIVFQETPSTDYLRPLGDYGWKHTGIKKSTCRDICYNELSDLFWKLCNKAIGHAVSGAVNGGLVVGADDEHGKLEAVTAALSTLCVGTPDPCDWASSDFWKCLKENGVLVFTDRH